ncbi:N-acetylmuramoyl-L-alanine amidase, partial [Sulfurimonas sp. SAG-AH-194-I05]
MLRLFFLFLALALSLSALTNKELLNRANDFMKSKSKSDHFRAYNDYKNIYLRSIMQEDKKLRINALKGILNSGTKLHIDIATYRKELLTLDTKKTKAPVVKQTIKAYLPANKNKNTIKIKSSNKLKSIGFENDKLVLRFDSIVGSKQINYFTLYNAKEKQFRYVFDISSSMLSKSKTLRKKGIKRIKLAQFKPNTLRLVIENTRKIDLKFFHKEEKIVISFNRNTSPSMQQRKNNKEEKKYTPPVRLDRNKIIVLDAGHGGKDPGAIGYKKYREKIIVMSITHKLRKILKSRGYKVFMTRDRDTFVKLSNRTKYANKRSADIFISIHANAVAKENAHKVHGVECYFLSKSKSKRAKNVAAKENSADLSDMNYYGKESFLNTLNSHNIVASNKLAIDLQRGMLGSLKKKFKDVHDGGVREGPFWVLVGAIMPSVLVEVGFITHPQEARNLVNVRYQQRLAQGLADGVE